MKIGLNISLVEYTKDEANLCPAGAWNKDRPIIKTKPGFTLRDAVEICKTCEQYTPPGSDCSPPGRCEWHADEVGRRCSNCYVEMLQSRRYPPKDVCLLRRREGDSNVS